MQPPPRRLCSARMICPTQMLSPIMKIKNKIAAFPRQLKPAPQKNMSETSVISETTNSAQVCCDDNEHGLNRPVAPSGKLKKH